MLLYTSMLDTFKHNIVSSLIILFCIGVFQGCSSPDTEKSFAHNEKIISKAQYLDCGISEAEHGRLMALDKHSFDQNMEGGWRKIANEGNCYSVAGQLIKDYIDHHNIKPQTGSNILFWHVGQMQAYSGQIEDALKYFSMSYDKLADDGTNEKEWALYAEGTIAFLKKDRESLIKAKNELANYKMSKAKIASINKMKEDNPKIKFPEGYPEKSLNLIALEGLLRCFDQPYSNAYGNCEQ